MSSASQRRNNFWIILRHRLLPSPPWWREEAKKYGYWGWQLDFEQMDLSYRDKYTAFVQQFGAAMAANGLESSVAVIAQTSDNPADYIKNEWQTLIGVYNYVAIGQAVDIVSIMSYDDAQSGGPVTRWGWLEQVIAYARQLMPANKISVGIGLYYWDWSTANGERIDIGGAQGIDNVLADHPVTAHQYFSAVSEAPYIEYIENKIEYILSSMARVLPRKCRSSKPTV